MKKLTILNTLAAVFFLSNSVSAQSIKFYKGSFCAAEFGCTNDEPLGLLVSKKRYQEGGA